MISGVFDERLDVLIIGIGVDGLIECPDEVLKHIKSRGIERVILKNTPYACRIYNDLYHEGKRVALLAHGTC